MTTKETSIILDAVRQGADYTSLTVSTRAKFINRIKEAIRAWRKRRQEAQAEARAEELKNRFAIKERAGRLFLTCDGVAFQEIDPSQQAGAVCELLQAARTDAQAYTSINR